jgi:hypothetical protein
MPKQAQDEKRRRTVAMKKAISTLEFSKPYSSQNSNNE